MLRQILLLQALRYARFDECGQQFSDRAQCTQIEVADLQGFSLSQLLLGIRQLAPQRVHPHFGDEGM